MGEAVTRKRSTPALAALGSSLEREFETLWKQLGGPPLEREYMFAKPRKWRFDFVHVATRVAIECEGGIFTSGRHTRGVGFVNDMAKYNHAALLGWLVHRVPGAGFLSRDPDKWLKPIMATIRAREARPCR